MMVSEHSKATEMMMDTNRREAAAFPFLRNWRPLDLRNSGAKALEIRKVENIPMRRSANRKMTVETMSKTGSICAPSRRYFSAKRFQRLSLLRHPVNEGLVLLTPDWLIGAHPVRVQG
jgi:hypothetical protein